MHASESQHWYDRHGNPVYEVMGANGKKRNCTLRDARVSNLLPGVSSIIAMEAKPALEVWKIEQALLSAITLPRTDGEADDDFIARAREDSRQQAKKAAERGTTIHALIQGAYEGLPYPLEEAPFVEPAMAFLEQRLGNRGWVAECSFAHHTGYGGKCDLRGDGVVVDFKCKDFGADKMAKDLAYPEHAMQLAAYARGFGFNRGDCLNIFVSTRIPGLIRVREWDDAEIEEAWEAFTLLHRLWKIRRKFDPSFVHAEAA